LLLVAESSVTGIMVTVSSLPSALALKKSPSPLITSSICAFWVECAMGRRGVLPSIPPTPTSFLGSND